MRNHNGESKIYSIVDVGTEISIYFTVIENYIEDIENNTGKPLPKGNESIMLIDDEEQIALLIKKKLETYGYNISVYTDSSVAYNFFCAKPDTYNLVVTDFTMPKMTGLKLVKKILKIRPNIPIILCTGFNELSIEEKAYKIGILSFIKKPIAKNTIMQIIINTLDSK